MKRITEKKASKIIDDFLLTLTIIVGTYVLAWNLKKQALYLFRKLKCYSTLSEAPKMNDIFAEPKKTPIKSYQVNKSTSSLPDNKSSSHIPDFGTLEQRHHCEQVTK